MHQEAHDQVAEWVKKYDAFLKGGRALDIGGRNVNGCARPLFRNFYVWSVVDKNCSNDVGVTIVGDFLDPHVDYLIKDRSRDLVICTEVLEHIEEEKQEVFLEKLHRKVRLGGSLFVTCATTGRTPHNCDGSTPCTEPYANVSPSLFEGLGHMYDMHELKYNTEIGDLYFVGIGRIL